MEAYHVTCMMTSVTGSQLAAGSQLLSDRKPWHVLETWRLFVRVADSPGVYWRPGIYSGPGVYYKFYGNYTFISQLLILADSAKTFVTLHTHLQ